MPIKDEDIVISFLSWILYLQVTYQKMKLPISSHNNQAEHHAPYHHAVCQHKLVALCPDLSVQLPASLLLVAAFVVPVGVALSFAAGRRTAVVAAEAHIAAAVVAVADSQHCIAAVAAAVLGRSLLERTCCLS